MISANGGLPAHRYTPQVTPRWPRGSEPASVYTPRHPSVLRSAECTQPSWEQSWTNRGAQTSSEVPGAGGPRIVKQKCQLTFSELALYLNWFVGPAESPSLRKHGLVSAQGPSSDCQFPAQVFVVKNA